MDDYRRRVILGIFFKRWEQKMREQHLKSGYKATYIVRLPLTSDASAYLEAPSKVALRRSRASVDQDRLG